MSPFSLNTTDAVPVSGERSVFKTEALSLFIEEESEISSSALPESESVEEMFPLLEGRRGESERTTFPPPVIISFPVSSIDIPPLKLIKGPSTLSSEIFESKSVEIILALM